MSATNSDLSTLHEKFAKFLKSELDGGECSASMATVIRQFLRDNNIDSDPDHPSEAVEDLRKTLEEMDEDEFPEFPN